MNLPKSRSEARKSGRRLYFTGLPCPHGHVSPRRSHNGTCDRCLRISNDRRRKLYPERVRAERRRYDGLPEPTRPEPANCELCGGHPNGSGSLHLDHCHASGKFRGWLCSDCNTGLGKLGDTAAGLQRAIAYLRRSGDVAE